MDPSAPAGNHSAGTIELFWHNRSLYGLYQMTPTGPSLGVVKVTGLTRDCVEIGYPPPLDKPVLDLSKLQTPNLTR